MGREGMSLCAFCDPGWGGILQSGEGQHCLTKQGSTWQMGLPQMVPWAQN